MTTLQQTLIDLFLSYFNDYLTVECFAEHNGISIATANAIIKEGKYLHEFKVSLNKTN